SRGGPPGPAPDDWLPPEPEPGTAGSAGVRGAPSPLSTGDSTVPTGTEEECAKPKLATSPEPPGTAPNLKGGACPSSGPKPAPKAEESVTARAFVDTAS